jgi:archaellum component FlaC
MNKTIFLVFVMLVGVLLTSACAAAPSSDLLPTAVPTRASDPWDQAVADAQQVLAEAELEAHFQYYQDTVDKIDDYLAQLEKIRPALKLLDTLKTTDLPVLGNVWELLVRALDKAYFGAGVALEQVDEELRDLLDSYERLQRLDELDQTSAAIQAFQADPSRQTLEPLGEEMARADFILAGVDKDAASLQEKVDALLAATDKVQSGLGLVSGLAPQLGETLQEVQTFVDNVATPVRGLSETLATMRSRIAEDRDVFWQIQDIIEKANRPQ